MSVTTRRAGSCILAIALASFTASIGAAETAEERKAGAAARTQAVAATPTTMVGTPITASGTAVVNFAELARQERLGLIRIVAPPRPLVRPEANEAEEEIPEVETAIGLDARVTPPPFVPHVASPSPTQSFIGLDDIPMVDSSYIIIPPDVNGAIGPTRVLEPLNNNIRVLNKADGSVVTTVGVNTFWAPSGASPNAYTDPRSVYDPYNGRFIMIMQADLDNPTGNSLVIGLSDTNDPIGNWHLYRTVLYQNASSALYDFPTLGFNRNWITVSINRFSSIGSLQGNALITIHYPSLLANTFTAFRFNRADFCAAPVQTYSATSDTEYVLVHLSSGGATYRCDRITGTGPAAPTYTASGTLTRTGGGWAQGSGQSLPQSAPNAGASACGATPCRIELIDAQIRTPPVFRKGNIWYAQTIGLPAGTFTRTAAQWTRITTPTGAFVEGGRIEDPTANATNGGKWYAYPQIAVNANLDFMVGYTQFSSAQHPSAGYSVKLAGDAAGTIREPLLYKGGDDYYHKTFGAGRNRWGDFSVAQVDPVDDMTLWTAQEYGKTRAGTDDGDTGSNSSRWGTWWAALAPPTVTIDPGPSLNEGQAGNTAFPFTVRLSSAYGLPITVSYQTADGSATAADNDYVPVSATVVIPAGSLTAGFTVNVVGDTQCETDETFTVTVTGASGAGITPGSIPIGAPSVATATILDDETGKTITASAGAGGSISPSGAVSVACGADQTFTITTADKCHVIADVVVDGASQGPITSYTFTNVQADHTITVSFNALGPFTVTASAGMGGQIFPDGAVSVGCGDSASFTIAAESCYAIADVVVDGVSQGPIGSYTFTDVQADHTIAATFAPAGLTLGETHTDVSCTGATDGSIDLTVGGGVPPYTFSWSHGATAEDLTGLAAGSYTVTVTDDANCFAELKVTVGVRQFTITATAGPNGAIAPAGAVGVSCGTNATFTVTPDPGYAIDQMDVDGTPIVPTTSYTFTNVTANHTISVTFKVGVLQVTGRPTAFALGRVQPNPTTGAMRLDFGLPVASDVRLSVLDLQGREIAVLARGAMPAGWHSASWNGESQVREVSAGIYFVRLSAGGKVVRRKFTIAR